MVPPMPYFVALSVSFILLCLYEAWMVLLLNMIALFSFLFRLWYCSADDAIVVIENTTPYFFDNGRVPIKEAAKNSGRSKCSPPVFSGTMTTLSLSLCPFGL